MSSGKHKNGFASGPTAGFNIRLGVADKKGIFDPVKRLTNEFHRPDNGADGRLAAVTTMIRPMGAIINPANFPFGAFDRAHHVPGDLIEFALGINPFPHSGLI